MMESQLSNISHRFPANWDASQKARAQTIFFQKLALEAHRFYAGKIQIIPRAPLPDQSWLNVWYTPGVSSVSTGIRDRQELSYDLSWRGNVVAVATDSTRVLGDGNVTPPGGLGVMEGKAYLMKILGGVDAVPICLDSRNAAGEHDPDILVDALRRLAPSFGAINLEDISQPNCYHVLDSLRADCAIPVWHDDAQGTGCVTLAAVFNALKMVGKELPACRIVLNGAGASNTTIARLLMLAGADPARMVLLDSRGGLHTGRDDIAADSRHARKWELCQTTNPNRIRDLPGALSHADLLISLSRPGPGMIQPEWIRAMAPQPIVFACANPTPEIYPHEAHQAGASIVATGRGDFPNQVNNSLGFPGILKGTLLVRARQITDTMALAAARAIAAFAERQGLSPERIMPTMDDQDVFAETAAAVAAQAVADGVAQRPLTPDVVLQMARKDIAEAQRTLQLLMTSGLIPPPPDTMIQACLDATIAAVES